MEISGKSQDCKRMSALAEASTLIQSLAAPYQAGDKVKAALGRASRRISNWCKAHGLDDWTENRIADLWRAERRVVVSADELDMLREMTRKEEAERADTQDILERLAFLERRLAEIDPQFHRQDVEALRAAAHSARVQTN